MRRAFALEQEAALLCHARFDLEPTRSVLFRSAASLALDRKGHSSNSLFRGGGWYHDEPLLHPGPPLDLLFQLLPRCLGPTYPLGILLRRPLRARVLLVIRPAGGQA